MASPNWPPDYHLPDYEGPYPVDELETARQILITCMTGDKVPLKLEKLKTKLGIRSKFGEAIFPPPLSKWKCVSGRHLSFPLSTASISSAATTADQMTEEGGGIDIPTINVEVEQKYERNMNISQRIQNCSATNTNKSLGSATLKRKATPELATDNISPKKFLSNTAAMASLGSLQNTIVNKELTPTIMRMYKCDFCPFWASDSDGMNQHLKQAMHFSGSLHNSIEDNGTYQVVSVERMLAVKNEHCVNTKLAVICPTCKDVFEDIFMCGLHHKYFHDGNGYYSICEIVHHYTALVPTVPQCSSCGETFSRLRALHKHWHTNPEHIPYKPPLDNQVFQVLFCPYCNRTSHDQDYYRFDSHVLLHKQDNVANLAMDIKHIKKCMIIETLPPFNTDQGHPDGVHCELIVLKNLHAYLKKTGCVKGKLKVVKMKIKILKSLLFEHVDNKCDDY